MNARRLLLKSRLAGALGRCRPRLIADWRQGHRFISVILWGIAVTLQAAWLFLPVDLKADVSPLVRSLWAYAILGFAVAGIGGRFIDQPGLLPDPPAPREPRP